jgi:selenocysteine lyase/cysteine desulfurase
VDTNAFVVSHVCYATGQVIPVRSLVEKIRKRFAEHDIRVIIDAAHYVGNGHYVDELRPAESYVFSTHKWLLSPEPAGVILTYESELRPYDAWQSAVPTSLPSTTSSVRSIMGLRASLELINRVGFGSLFMRSSKLRDYFKKRISFRFQVVGDMSGLSETFMLGIKPRPGFRWKYYDADSLREYFKGQSVSVLVLRIDENMPWVRISFPYFLEIQQVRALLKILDDAVTDDKR